MVKMIFFILAISLLAIYFAPVIQDSTTMIITAISSIESALLLILSVVLVPFSSMLSFYYIKIALFVGVLFFVTSYILKWLTGHHLTTEIDTNSEYKEHYDYLKNKEWDARNNYLYNSDNKELRIEYARAKADRELWEHKLLKQKYEIKRRKWVKKKHG